MNSWSTPEASCGAFPEGAGMGLSGKFLIVTADDFGLHRAINDAVGQAAVGGILTAASLMVGAPAAAEAVLLASSLPRLRVGLHLVLTDGAAILPPRLVPALVDSAGRFANAMVSNSIRFVASRQVRGQLAAEIRAQFEAFAATGLPLDHVNAHKHFHLHPLILELILQIGREFGALAIRVPQEPWWFSRQSGGLMGNAFLLPWLGRMRRRLLSRGIAINDTVFGVSCSGQLDTPRMLAILARLPPGVTEIYSHPAVSTPRAITTSMKTYRHADELRALTDPSVRRAVADSGAVCGGYRDLQWAS
jgi:hopanoid biosynthesis associated protein HpnK